MTEFNTKIFLYVSLQFISISILLFLSLFPSSIFLFLPSCESIILSTLPPKLKVETDTMTIFSFCLHLVTVDFIMIPTTLIYHLLYSYHTFPNCPIFTLTLVSSLRNIFITTYSIHIVERAKEKDV